MSVSVKDPMLGRGPASRADLYRLHRVLCATLLDRLTDPDCAARASILAVVVSFLNSCGINREVSDARLARIHLEELKDASSKWNLDELELPITTLGYSPTTTPTKGSKGGH